ncbi:MAG: ADP-ribosylglycohydrolase family protein [Desulfovibrionales bacterium]|nr:ADP-ribosylglycohydrolase family protein [Desulfovibrionales bacterium]
MHGNPRNAILAAFAADSLALGVHWVYDTDAIARRYGRVTSVVKPELAPFHQGREAGDLTHYGDQMLLLLRHVAGAGGFDPEGFAAAWRDSMRSYAGYLDQASRQTLAALDSGRPPLQAGSASSDLSGAARMAPLLILALEPEALAGAARLQAQLTHSSPLVLAAAELLARACPLVMAGAQPDAALEQAARETGDLTVADLVRRGLAARDQDVVTAVRAFGQSCAAMSALPGAVQIVARHGGDLRLALEENVMAGGDSAARGMFVATLLGCRPGASIPAEWLGGLRCRDEVLGLFERINRR